MEMSIKKKILTWTIYNKIYIYLHFVSVNWSFPTVRSEKNKFGFGCASAKTVNTFGKYIRHYLLPNIYI